MAVSSSSSSCNSIGAAIDKLGMRSVHQGAPNGAESSFLLVSPLNVDCLKSVKATEDHSGHLTTISPIVPSKNHASRFASIAVAATAWAGLSMCPIEALAAAYVGESVFNTPTNMLQLSGYVTLSKDLDIASQFYEGNDMRTLDVEAEAAVGIAPSITPPNEGRNSPWLPKMDGLKKKDDNKRASMRCPKWSQSELEMVLPDFQGRPKPFPRMQGRIYPFWPAARPSTNGDDNGDYENLESKQSSDESKFFIKLAFSMRSDGGNGPDDRERLPSLALPPQQRHMPTKKPSCYTM